MSKPLFDIAVVLINYNNLQDTTECLEGIASSKGTLPFVLVVDNASADGDRIEAALSFYPHVKCFTSKVNLGFARANNLAINWVNENLNTRYTFLLNNDTVLEPSTLTTLKEALEYEPRQNAALAAPLIRVYSGTREIWYAGGSINFNKMVPDVVQE